MSSSHHRHRHRLATAALAIAVEYLYETDPDFENALDKALFGEHKKERKKSKFALEKLVKKQAKLTGSKRKKRK